MTDTKPITSFQLPKGKQIDVFLVTLADGRTVARTRDELEVKPAAVSSTPETATPGEGESHK